MSTDPTNHLISRDRAVQQLAGHITARDSYIITVPPAALAAMAERLDDLTGWMAYVDNGTGLILRTGQRGTLDITHMVSSAATVVVVPRTTPAGELSAVIGQEIPADGSQDIVILTGPPGAPVFWPALFVAALDLTAPETAAALREAHDNHTPTA